MYEVKGLEFDDVILFNFFTESEAEGLWKILDDIQIFEEKELKTSSIILA